MKVSNNKDDILFTVLNELLHEELQEVTERINSQDFKNTLKERMEEKGVMIDFRNMKSITHIDGVDFPKYMIDDSSTMDDITEDIVFI